MNKIGEYLKQVREKKELSTVDVQKASQGRISQSYVVQVENGQRTPSVEKLEAFADVYGVNIHDFVEVMITSKKAIKQSPEIVLSKKEIELIKQIRKLTDKKRKGLLDFISE